MEENTPKELKGQVTQAITGLGLALGESIDFVFDGGTPAHKEALRKIFSDALNEVNRRLLI